MTFHKAYLLCTGHVHPIEGISENGIRRYEKYADTFSLTVTVLP